jgi:hypothetical protein
VLLLAGIFTLFIVIGALVLFEEDDFSNTHGVATGGTYDESTPHETSPPDTERLLMGTWFCPDNNNEWYHNITFNADSRFFDNDGDWGTYNIVSNRITFLWDDEDYGSVTVAFELDGDSLKFNNSEIDAALRRQMY